MKIWTHNVITGVPDAHEARLVGGARAEYA